jgi:flavin reductase (DIM6/NTAB) family NADH-FMN oxidoreductase RutF
MAQTTDVTGPVPSGRDPEGYDRLRRRALWAMPTGLFVVGSRSGDRVNLMTANWVMQVSITPKLVAASIEVGSVTEQLLEEGGTFSVSVLARDDRALVRKFVKPVDDQVVDDNGQVVSLQGVPVHEVTGGVPVIDAARWWLACEIRTIDRLVGSGEATPSHVLCIGEVADVGEGLTAPSGEDDEEPGVLRMEDTRMHYGG